MTETENQAGVSRSSPPSQTTTIGAIARIGIVCEATMYGRKPRCSSRDSREHDGDHEPDARAEHEADGGLLGCEEGCVPEHLDQQRAVPP